MAVSIRLRLYCIPNEIRPETIFKWTAENTLAVCTATVLATFFSRQLGAGVSRMFVICLAPVAFATFALTRCAALGTVALLQRRWQPPRIALVGDFHQANLLANTLDSRVAKTIRGIVVSETTLAPVGIGQPLPVLGTTRRLGEVVNREQIDCAIIMSRSLPDSEVEHCKRVLWRMGLPVSYVLDLPHELRWTNDGLRMHRRVQLSKSYGLPTVEFRPILFARTQDLVKRAFDVGFSSLLLFLIGPAMGVIAILLKVTSSGPVFEKRLHVGKGGRYFNSLKFRTTQMKDSKRVTALGRLLVRFRSDELPQLANILRGKMSFVGPAPLPVDALEIGALCAEDVTWFKTRSVVQPGLTGLWQVAHSTLSFEEMVQLDLEYIQHHSFSLDLSILLATPIPVIRGTRLPELRRSMLGAAASAS
ncbi:MAG: sugar transferase [Acidobacteriaceae bacterium]|nr:sugar transferase [Acidobacteriaceae bacterium]